MGNIYLNYVGYCFAGAALACGYRLVLVSFGFICSVDCTFLRCFYITCNCQTNFLLQLQFLLDNILLTSVHLLFGKFLQSLRMMVIKLFFLLVLIKKFLFLDCDCQVAVIYNHTFFCCTQTVPGFW